jgi:hypothetical protein
MKRNMTLKTDKPLEVHVTEGRPDVNAASHNSFKLRPF